jgi:hypothetical protein
VIFNRPANLAMGAFTAVLNVLALAHPLGFAPNTDLLAAINMAAGAVITFFAYQTGQALAKANGTP